MKKITTLSLHLFITPNKTQKYGATIDVYSKTDKIVLNKIKEVKLIKPTLKSSSSPLGRNFRMNGFMSNPNKQTNFVHENVESTETDMKTGKAFINIESPKSPYAGGNKQNAKLISMIMSRRTNNAAGSLCSSPASKINNLVLSSKNNRRNVSKLHCISAEHSIIKLSHVIMARRPKPKVELPKAFDASISNDKSDNLKCKPGNRLWSPSPVSIIDRVIRSPMLMGRDRKQFSPIISHKDAKFTIKYSKKKQNDFILVNKSTNRRYRKVNVPINKIREEINSVEEMLSIDHNFRCYSPFEFASNGCDKNPQFDNLEWRSIKNSKKQLRSWMSGLLSP